VAVFPADTVYGLGCDPANERAVRRLYELKGRPPERASAVMFFELQGALGLLSELGRAERELMRALLPGPLTLLVGNPLHRFPAACGPDPGTLGIRVPILEGPLAALRSVGVPMMQSSANISGEPDARRLADVPLSVREAADLVLNGGELPGLPSTVLDMRKFGADGSFSVLREGAVSAGEISRRLDRRARP